VWCSVPVLGACLAGYQVQLPRCCFYCQSTRSSFPVSSGIDGCHCNKRGVIEQHIDTDAKDYASRTSQNAFFCRSKDRHIHHQDHGCIDRFGLFASHYRTGAASVIYMLPMLLCFTVGREGSAEELPLLSGVYHCPCSHEYIVLG
jgi:hypothetical protein